MRRKTVKTLADLGRLIPLAVCLFAGSVAWIWTHHADAVAAFEKRLVHLLTGRFWGQFEAAGKVGDPAVEHDLLEGLAHDLEHVRSQDRLSDMVEKCHTRLIALAEAKGDLDEALSWARASVAFDGQHVRTLVRLGEVLCARPETRDQGLAHLSALSRKFAGNPHVARALAAQLAAAGRGAEALDVLDAACAVPQSNRWIVLWDEGQGYEESNAHQIPVVVHDCFRLRFDIVGRCKRVRFLTPLFASFTLVQPMLHVVVNGETHVLSLLGPSASVSNMATAGDRLEAVGVSDAFVEVVLPEVAADRWEFTLVAGWQPRRSSLIASPTLLPRFAALRDEWANRGETAQLARLQGWRAVAYAGQPVDLYYRHGKEPFAGVRKVSGTLGTLPDGGFAVEFQVDKPASQLRVDLPADAAGISYRLTKLDVVVDGRLTSLDPRTLELKGTNEVERRDGTFVATGNDPFFWFDAPAGDVVNSVRVEGAP
ncbi:MAG TPA: hypothetical protein VFZ65_21080 [Planctomycetota bacterium]|nr:hypothetical protein [Planctomycetota bacterium]